MANRRALKGACKPVDNDGYTSTKMIRTPVSSRLNSKIRQYTHARSRYTPKAHMPLPEIPSSAGANTYQSFNQAFRFSSFFCFRFSLNCLSSFFDSFFAWRSAFRLRPSWLFAAASTSK